MVGNYSCQKPRVCLFMILTQIGLNLVIPLFSCHFLHIHMVVECILALSSMLHLIWNGLKWKHKSGTNSNLIWLVLPSARTTCLCQFSGHFRHFLEKLIKKAGMCKIISWILTWWTLDCDVLCHSKPEVCSGISEMNKTRQKKHQHLGWTR